MPRLLVIEDDSQYRPLLVEILEAEGFEVEARGDGASGVARARETQPDLILCDIVMSGMDGYGVVAALRQDPVSAVIPVVFLTGIAGADAVRKGMNVGADDYLVKPVKRDDLVRAVRARLLRHADARNETRRRLDRLRADLAKSLPHEFLTPLTAVIGLSSLLMEEKVVEPAAVPEVARGIFLGGQRLHEIISKSLLLAELEAAARGPGHATDPADPGVDDAGALVEEAARGRAARVGRETDVEVSVESVSLPMSKEHLRPLVEELVENALASSAPGSPVRVACGRERDHCTLSVSDAGCGMTGEQVAGLERLAAFSRRHAGQPGLGLGLAIVRRVAELDGGELAFETAPGRGTTVRVRLRLRRI